MIEDKYSSISLEKLNEEEDEPPKEVFFVYTSNIDGHFTRVPTFQDRVVECHGSTLFLQCQNDYGVDCTQGNKTWALPQDGLSNLTVDPKTHLVSGKFPLCPGTCNMVARPDVLMFGDFKWVGQRTSNQEDKFYHWKDGVDRLASGKYIVTRKEDEEQKGEDEKNKKKEAVPFRPTAYFPEDSDEEDVDTDITKGVVVEIGAGTTIPTVRHQAERFCEMTGATLIRINVHDSHPPYADTGSFWKKKTEIETQYECLSLPLGALEALSVLDWLIEKEREGLVIDDEETEKIEKEEGAEK